MTTVSAIVALGLVLAGCETASPTIAKAPPLPALGLKPTAVTVARPAVKVTYNYTTEDRECLKRAMYTESEKQNDAGYMAVGSVVANRLTSPAYPKTICGVVSQKRQFAPNVMKAKIADSMEQGLDRAADAILRGERHPQVTEAMFFHAQGLKFHYDNMKYVAFAGGNAFYEKKDGKGELLPAPPLPAYEISMNWVAKRTPAMPQFEKVSLPTVHPQAFVFPGVATAGSFTSPAWPTTLDYDMATPATR